MQQAAYKIVSYRPEYKGQLVEVQKHLWGPDLDLNAAYLDWKHLRNPYLREPLIYLAVHGEKVVGMRSFIGAMWEFGSPRQTLVMPLASDMVIAPEHRNRGLFTLIMKAALKDLAEKGYTYVVNLGAAPVTLLGQLTMGWRGVGSLQPMECTVARRESLPQVRAFLKKSPLAVAVYRRLRRKVPISPRESRQNHFDTLDSISDQRHHHLGRHISIEKSPRTGEMVDFAGRLDQDRRIRHVRDEGYYGWRFQNPRSQYRFLFWCNSKMEGYVVLQATASPSTEPICLVDWQATSDQVRAELLKSVLQLASGRTLLTWAGTLAENERRILETAGFRRFDQAGSLNSAAAAVRPVRDEMLNQEWLLGDQRLLDIRNWDFRMMHSRYSLRRVAGARE
jgi:GNAT superfamily N-acetyltransferase